MNIQKATIDDLQEILDLQKKAFYSEAVLYNDFNISPLHQTIEEITQEFFHKQILLIKQENRIIASVRFYKENTTGHIGKLIVHPDFQNIGLGRILMNEAEKLLQNCLRVELFTGSLSIKNIHLYKSLGYSIFNEIKETEHVSLVIMEKML